MHAEAGRILTGSAIEREPRITVTVAARSAAPLPLLGGQREVTGDHRIGCVQVRDCSIFGQGLPRRGPRQFQMRLRPDRPSRCSRKKRPPGSRVQIRTERLAVHVPAVAMHRASQPDIKPGRKRDAPTPSADGRGARSRGPCHEGRCRRQRLIFDELAA
jgi:hypothetical protein